MRLLLFFAACIFSNTSTAQNLEIPFSFPVKAKWNEAEGFTSRIYAKEGIISYSYESNDSICRLLIDSIGNIIGTTTEARWFTNYSPSIKEMPKYLNKPNYFFSSEFKCIGGIVDTACEYVFFSNRNAGGILANVLTLQSGISVQKIIDPLIGEKILKIISYPGKFEVLTFKKEDYSFSIITIETGLAKSRINIPMPTNLTAARKDQLAEMLEESHINYLTKAEKSKDPLQTFQVRSIENNGELDLFYLTGDSLFFQRLFILKGTSEYHQFSMENITGTEKDLILDNLAIIKKEAQYLISYLAKERFTIHAIDFNNAEAQKIFEVENKEENEDAAIQKNMLYKTSPSGDEIGKGIAFSSLFKNQKIKHLRVKAIEKQGRQYLQVQTLLIASDKPLNKILSAAGSALYASGIGALAATIAVAAAGNFLVHNSLEERDLFKLPLESQMFFLTVGSDGVLNIAQHGSEELKAILATRTPKFATSEKSRFINVAVLNSKFYVLSQAEKGSNLSLEIQ